MLLLPAAKVDDGVLDVVMLRPKGRFGWARIGTRVAVQGVAHRSRFGRAMLVLAPDLQALAYAQGRDFTVRFNVPHRVELDGDSFGTVIAARITVRPAALQVCTANTEPWAAAEISDSGVDGFLYAAVASDG
jgi:diacylglycerol kinase family enzyme